MLDSVRLPVSISAIPPQHDLFPLDGRAGTTDRQSIELDQMSQSLTASCALASPQPMPFLKEAFPKKQQMQNQTQHGEITKCKLQSQRRVTPLCTMPSWPLCFFCRCMDTRKPQ